MEIMEVTVVRIYTLERAENVPLILDYLQNEAKIRGLSLHRGLSGFGETGIQSESFLDLSFSLPLIVEFFDEAEKIKATLEYLSTLIKAERLLLFKAQANI